MCIFKRDKKLYLDIFYKKKCGLNSIIIAFGIALILLGVYYVKINPLPLIDGIDINKNYANGGLLWSEPLLERDVPIFMIIVICFAFYEDYIGNAYEILTFYNKEKFNALVFSRWLVYTVIILFIALANVFIQYIYRIESILDVLVLMMRFIPPILFISSLCLFVIVIFKNFIPAFVVSIIYVVLDQFSGGRLFKVFTLMGNSFFLENKSLFYINRLSLTFASVIFVYFACRKSSKI